MADNTKATKTLRCSFCGKEEHQVHRMVQGPGVRICDECVELCVAILEDDYATPAPVESVQQLPTPRQIKGENRPFCVGVQPL